MLWEYKCRPLRAVTIGFILAHMVIMKIFIHTFRPCTGLLRFRINQLRDLSSVAKISPRGPRPQRAAMPFHIEAGVTVWKEHFISYRLHPLKGCHSVNYILLWSHRQPTNPWWWRPQRCTACVLKHQICCLAHLKPNEAALRHFAHIEMDKSA